MAIDRRRLARSIIALAVCAVWLCTSPIAAQQRPCLEDVKKLCPGVQPGSPEARQCLASNMDKVSAPCRERITKGRGRRQGYPARLRGCETDLDKHCKGVTPGGGRLIQCLRAHESELSAECKARVPGGRANTPSAGQTAAAGDTSSAPTAVVTAQPTVPAK